MATSSHTATVNLVHGLATHTHTIAAESFVVSLEEHLLVCIAIVASI
jgi:hypothetical protein